MHGGGFYLGVFSVPSTSQAVLEPFQRKVCIEVAFFTNVVVDCEFLVWYVFTDFPFNTMTFLEVRFVKKGQIRPITTIFTVIRFHFRAVARKR